MRLTLSLAILLALPGVAAAEEQCKFSEPRSLDLQLTGVKSVLFEVASNDLHLDASPSGGGKLSGRACAARAELLKSLTVTQKRVGDKLVVTLNMTAGSPSATATPTWICAAACPTRCWCNSTWDPAMRRSTAPPQ
ncbi:hypothetical protein HZS93_04716 [Xanthomonas citri]|nr:hypothetical protein HZS93_04716 [Xanthomonas citri]